MTKLKSHCDYNLLVVYIHHRKMGWKWTFQMERVYYQRPLVPIWADKGGIKNTLGKVAEQDNLSLRISAVFKDDIKKGSAKNGGSPCNALMDGRLA